MRLNRLGRAAMNQPGRVLAQRAFVAPLMLRLAGSVAGSTVLEVGCGRGVGVAILVKRFGAGQVNAFGLDEAMLDLARRRLRGLPPDRFDLSRWRRHAYGLPR